MTELYLRCVIADAIRTLRELGVSDSVIARCVLTVNDGRLVWPVLDLSEDLDWWWSKKPREYSDRPDPRWVWARYLSCARACLDDLQVMGQPRPDVAVEFGKFENLTRSLARESSENSLRREGKTAKRDQLVNARAEMKIKHPNWSSAKLNQALAVLAGIEVNSVRKALKRAKKKKADPK